MAGYRDGVCIVVRNRQDQGVLLCHRIGYPPTEGWQFPQGGLHLNEDPAAGAQRELREEIGTDRVVLLRITDGTYCYEVPGGHHKGKEKYSGQCLRWILAEMHGSKSEIRFEGRNAEFDACEWVEPAEALRRIVGFKRKAYREAMAELDLIPETKD